MFLRKVPILLYQSEMLQNLEALLILKTNFEHNTIYLDKK